MVWPWKRGGGRGDRTLDRVGQQASGPGLSDGSPVGSSGPSTRALGPPRPASGMAISGLRAIPTGAVSADRPAYDLAGVDPSGRPIEVAVLSHPGRILLAFLAVDCNGCEQFWQGIGDPATLPASPDPLSWLTVRRAGSSVRRSLLAGRTCVRCSRRLTRSVAFALMIVCSTSPGR